MPETVPVKSEAQPPQAQLIQMATAHWVSRILYVVAGVDRKPERPRERALSDEEATSVWLVAPENDY